MDFEDVELKVLIKTMSEILEENFIISSKVEGRVSVSAPRNVSKKESLNMLKDILIVHGYVMIETPESFEITSAEDTKNLPGYFSSGKSIPEELLMSNSIITHVIPLEYTDAEEVKNLLTPLVSAGGYVGSNKETNMIVMTGDVKNIKNLLDIIKNVDQQHSSKGRNDLTVIKCNNISSLKVAEMLDKLYTSKLRMAGRTESAAYPAFIAHEESNSLLISANASETEKIVSALHTIDQQKKQVLVKAVIAEVTERTAKEIGFDILSTGGILYATEKGFAKIEDLGMNKALLGGADADNLAVSYAEGTNDFSGTIIPDISWVVKLSKKHDGIDIISTPKLLTVDNEEAEIIVGTNLAYLKDSQVTPQGGTVKTFDFKDVGLKLSIKPRISSNDMITLTLSQQLEEVLGLSFEGGVETSKRSISTTVILKDRSLAVIGGLTADNKNKSTQGVPFISKIPIIGNLFKKNSEKSEKRNLLLFITAQIVRTPQEMKDITDIESKGSNIKAEK
ncbi:MAG: hypothetical protein KAI43_12025 [Candidatus Aureabacteria bacterium]|nr:hypothetical protein [Candidatus Auribacterota bacterium]